jgi:hypothetical protein
MSNRYSPGDSGAQADDASNKLQPDRKQIETFLDALFRYAGREGFVSLRSFYDEANETKPFKITPIPLAGGLTPVVDAAARDAAVAANNRKKVVFCPPVAVFINGKKAREKDLLRGPALSVECDQNPQASRARLEQILGPATIVVASGGEWTDAATDEIQPKLHLHWRLKKPAEGEALATLKVARRLAAELVGGDPSNVPVSHPIRWPGSWHRKREPVLCGIEAVNPDCEIDLTEALKALTEATGKSGEQPRSEDNRDNRGDAGNQPNDWGTLVKDAVTGFSYHESLIRLAARLVGSGMHDGTTVKLLRGLMEAFEGPRDERWRARYADIPRSVSTAREKYGQAGQAAPKLILTLAEWAARDLPPPDYICGNWLTTTSRVLVVAPTGLGKTMFGMGLGMATAAGEGFLHWRGIRRARVLFIDGEMSNRLLKRRLADEARRLGVSPGSFFALSRDDFPVFEPLNTPEGQAFVDRLIQEIGGVDLVIFDNIMSLIAGDQKEEEGWRQTMPWVLSLTRRSIGQIWVHHTGHDESRSYGTKTREWQMDTVLHLERVERADTDVSFQLEFRKARERTPQTRGEFADVRVALVNDRWDVREMAGGTKMKISPLANKFLEALGAAAAGVEANKVFGGMGASLEGWRAECARRGLIEPQEKPISARTLFNRYKRELIAANRIACDETTAWIIPPAEGRKRGREADMEAELEALCS